MKDLSIATAMWTLYLPLLDSPASMKEPFSVITKTWLAKQVFVQTEEPAGT